MWPFPAAWGWEATSLRHEHPTEDSLGTPTWDLPGAGFCLWWGVSEEAEGDSVLDTPRLG